MADQSHLTPGAALVCWPGLTPDPRPVWPIIVAAAVWILSLSAPLSRCRGGVSRREAPDPCW